MSESEVFTISEVARQFKLSPITIRRLISRGEIAAIKIGGSYRIRADEVRRMVEQKLGGEK